MAGAARRVRAREPVHRRARSVAWAYIGLDWVAGILWFMLKTYVLRVHVRVDARHAPARAHRPADGLRLEVAAAGVAAQPVRHGGGHRRGRAMRRRMSFVPGLGIVKGMALTLRRFFEPKVTVMYPEVRLDVPHKFRGRLQLLYDEWGTLKCETCFQCAQACPIECIDMGGIDTRGRYHVHWGAARDVRRAARGIGASPVRPGRPGPRVPAVRADRPGRGRRDPRRARPRPGATCSRSSRRPRRPMATCRSRRSSASATDRGVVRDDLRDRDLLRPPPVRAADGDRAGRRRSTRTGPPSRPTWRRSAPRSREAVAAGAPARA